MSRFIFVSSDSGAGCLKQARIATRVACFSHQLVHGPVPFTTEPFEFFAARTALLSPDTEDWEIELNGPEASTRFFDEITAAGAHDEVEIWIDPTPNAHLMLLQLLDWLRTKPNLLPKLSMVFLERPLSSQTPEWAANLNLKLTRVDAPWLELATVHWSAFRQSTPQTWFELSRNSQNVLPHLSTTVTSMLQELPDAKTGLLGTQRQILELISQGYNTPSNLMRHANWFDDAQVFSYWQRGKFLADLAVCSKPAVSGMNGEEFTLDMHDDQKRHKAFFQSRLELTAFGQALLDGREDFAQHNTIDRWWGGTRLTNQNLWRWNSANQALIGPAKL
jgi:hypothetical protein